MGGNNDLKTLKGERDALKTVRSHKPPHRPTSHLSHIIAVERDDVTPQCARCFSENVVRILERPVKSDRDVKEERGVGV